MDFEWDAMTATLNFRKHGVAFEDAVQVFLDPLRVDVVDDRDDYGEANHRLGSSSDIGGCLHIA